MRPSAAPRWCRGAGLLVTGGRGLASCAQFRAGNASSTGDRSSMVHRRCCRPRAQENRKKASNRFEAL